LTIDVRQSIARRTIHRDLGDTTLAIENRRKSLALDPANGNAEEVLKRLVGGNDNSISDIERQISDIVPAFGGIV